MNILIVEDEAIIAEDLSFMLEKNGYSVIDICPSYESAIAAQKNQVIDLALIDINLKGPLSGIDFGNYLHDNADIPFIYTSSLGDKTTINKAKYTRPSSYLVKPFGEQQLIAAIEIAMETFGQSGDSHTESVDKEQSHKVFNDAFFIKDHHRYIKLPISDIQYCKKADNYIELVTLKRKHLIRKPLQVLMDELEGYQFFKCHKSYIVNLNYLQEIRPTEIVLQDHSVPMARNYHLELRKKLNIQH